jgi:two-component system invasion response regulator UvrY
VLRILVADDHAMVRAGICKIVAELLGPVRLGESSTADETLEQVRDSEWDLVLLDITMPGQTGMDVLGEIKKLRPQLPVLVVSMHAEEQFAIRALRSGAAGYITKERAPEELVQAITRVLNRRLYVSDALAERLAHDRATGRGAAPHEALSSREFAVLLALATGSSVSDVALQLHISAKTVSTYRTRILEKLQLRTNADLTRYALQHGLVD